jgi:DUF917 family protein
MQLTTSQLADFLVGSTILCTGGGGPYPEAQQLLKNVTSVELIDLADLPDDAIVFTAFGVGGSVAVDPVASVKLALQEFNKLFPTPPAAIIPVEVGPLSTATSFFIANAVNTPVVNADIVGFRSSPEVFLETITLKNLDREPCVVSNGHAVATLHRTSSHTFTEQFLRQFAVASGGEAYVVGYPLRVKDIRNLVGEGSIQLSIDIGTSISELQRGQLSLAAFCQRHGFELLTTGTISDDQKNVSGGYTTGKMVIQADNQDQFEVYYKNENIVVMKNDDCLVTAPELITVLNLETHLGINNYLPQPTGTSVALMARKAFAVWRTPQGRELFSPKKLGFVFPQKLLP